MSAQPLALIARALDPTVEPPSDALSQRILDAALALAAASGLRHLTMDDIARRARVGRMTVYRRFGDKERLIEALAVRESRRFLVTLDAAAPTDAPIEQQVAEAFVTSLRLAREHPLLNRLARLEPESILDSAVAEGGGLFALACAFVAGRLRASQAAGVLGEIDVEETAELIARIMFSFVLIQETILPLDDEDRAREFARRVIAPLFRT